jgi:hypothetical protein
MTEHALKTAASEGYAIDRERMFFLLNETIKDLSSGDDGDDGPDPEPDPAPVGGELVSG